MKFYVAGKWEEREEIRKIHKALQDKGHTITIDWTWHEKDDPGYPSQYAVEDIIGATACGAIGIWLCELPILLGCMIFW